MYCNENLRTTGNYRNNNNIYNNIKGCIINVGSAITYLILNEHLHKSLEATDSYSHWK